MALSGQFAPSLLATIPGTSRQVRADLLGGVVALRVAFAARFGRGLVVTDGYRSYESQVAIFTARNTTTYLPGRPVSIWNGRKWYRKPGTASAAVPGTSNHGWGRALDLGSGVNSSLTSPEYLWMRANAPRFGWTHPAWARRSPTLEPWHWEGVPVAAYVGNVIGTLPDPLTPLPLSEEDDDMIPLIERTYRDLCDRTGSLDEIAFWHDAARGRTAAWFLTAFRANKAEPGTVRAAWRLYLHEASAAEVAFQLSKGYSIGRLFEVAAEAAAKGQD